MPEVSLPEPMPVSVPEPMQDTRKVRDYARTQLNTLDKVILRERRMFSVLHWLLIGLLGLISGFGMTQMLNGVRGGTVVLLASFLCVLVLSVLVTLASPMKTARYLAVRDDLRRKVHEFEFLIEFDKGRALSVEDLNKLAGSVRDVIEA